MALFFIFLILTEKLNNFQIRTVRFYYISVKPTVSLNCSSPITVNEGNEFTCACRGEGQNPPANVTWLKDGIQIAETGREEQTLTLRSVDETDNGTYKCVAQSYTDAMFSDQKIIEIIIRLNCKYFFKHYYTVILALLKEN